MPIVRVIPNPYSALDADGVPQGVVGAGMPGVFIGAQVDQVASARTGKVRLYFPLNKRAGEGESELAYRVHFSTDIATAVRCGDLLAADPETAKMCGISEEDYLRPEEILAAEEVRAGRELALHMRAVEPRAIPREPEASDGENLEKAIKQLTPTIRMTKET